MPELQSIGFVVFVAAVFVLGGFVKGVVGLGLPTVVVGLLSLLIPSSQAAALLIVPSLATNLWQLGGPGLAALLKRLAPLLLGVCAGVWVGAGWLSAGADGRGALFAGLGLGVALVAYAALGLMNWRPRLRPVSEAWLAPPAGLATGLVTAATGVFVIPAVPFLQALGMEKEELVRALGLSFLVSTIALAAALGKHGALPATVWLGSVLALLPALAGMAIGQRLRLRVAAETFKRVFFAGLLVLGVYLVIRNGLRLR